jgi:hypothetical protein
MLKNVYSVRIGPPQAKVSSFQQSRDTLQPIRIDRRIRVNAGAQDVVGLARFESNRAIVLNVSNVLPTDSLAFCIAAALTYHRDKDFKVAAKVVDRCKPTRLHLRCNAKR